MTPLYLPLYAYFPFISSDGFYFHPSYSIYCYLKLILAISFCLLYRFFWFVPLHIFPRLFHFLLLVFSRGKSTIWYVLDFGVAYVHCLTTYSLFPLLFKHVHLYSVFGKHCPFLLSIFFSVFPHLCIKMVTYDSHRLQSYLTRLYWSLYIILIFLLFPLIISIFFSRLFNLLSLGISSGNSAIRFRFWCGDMSIALSLTPVIVYYSNMFVFNQFFENIANFFLPSFSTFSSSTYKNVYLWQ